MKGTAKKTFIILPLLFLAIINFTAATPEAPSYAKWGRLAVQTAMEKYPNAQIVDYLHIGREDKDQASIEKFKLWAKEGQVEYGIFINIQFDPTTEQVLNISVRKSAK